MENKDSERQLLAALPDVAVPASLDPQALATQLPGMARRVKARRTRRAVTFAACFVLLAGLSIGMAPRFLAKSTADGAAEESVLMGARAEDPQSAYGSCEDSAAGADAAGDESVSDSGEIAAPQDPLLDEAEEEEDEKDKEKDKDKKDVASSAQVNG